MKCFKESVDVTVSKEAAAFLQDLTTKAPNVSLKVVNLLVEKGIGSVDVLANTSASLIAQELQLGLVFELQVRAESVIFSNHRLYTAHYLISSMS